MPQQQRVGWRPYTATSGSQNTTTVSSLLTSLYGAWNADTLGTSLDKSIYGVWNGENEENLTSLETSLFAVYNGESTNDYYGTNNGTAVGTLTYTTGKVGNAFSFNGTNSYVSLPNNSLNFTGDFSVSFWVNLASGVNTWKSVLSNYKAGGSFGYGYQIGVNEYYDKLQIFIRNNNQITQQWFDYTFTANVWYHVVISRKASNYTKCYINGTLISGYYPVGGQNDPTFNPAYISGQIANIGGSNNTASLNGKLDSVNIWTKELTQTEASQLYNSGVGIEYPFVGKLLSSPKDSVGTNHGTLMNGTTFTTGKVGQAFTFDGVNDYVALPNNSLNFTGDFSFSLWMNRKLAVNANILSNYYNGATPYGWWLSISNGTIVFRMGNGTATTLCNISTALLGANVWQLITITKNGTSVKMYVDGVLKTSATITGNVVYTTTHYPMIGAAKYDAGAPVGYLESGCLIDGVSTWQKELSQDEITQLYNLGTGTQYPFSGQTLPSANNQFAIDNGTLMNGCTFTDGKIGKAFTFDGVNDFVKFPAGSMNFSGDFSISGWINLPGVYNGTKEVDILMNVTAPSWFSSPKGFWLATAGNLVTFNIYNGTSSAGCSWDDSTGSIIKGNSGWIHIIATRKVSTGSKLYVNGVLKASNTSTLDPTYDSRYQTPSMGALYVLDSSGGVVNNSVFSPAGTKIDGLSVWQKELTQSEITELYNSGAGKQLTVATPIVTNGLVVNLDPSRTSSWPNTTYTVANQTWYDISGNGNNSTLINGPAFGTASGGVITFDGINDYGTIPYTIQTQFTNKLTINVWVKPSWFDTGNGDGVNIVSKCMSSLSAPYTIFGLAIGPDGGYGGSIGNGGARVLLSSTNKTTLNTWVNLCITYDGSTIKLYKNGVQDPSTAACSYTLGQNTVPITIASHQTLGNFYDWFKGDIGMIQMYNTGLSSADVLQNFNATKSRFGL